MKLNVDREADALYLRLDDSEIVESEEASPGVVLDYSEAKEVVGVELAAPFEAVVGSEPVGVGVRDVLAKRCGGLEGGASDLYVAAAKAATVRLSRGFSAPRPRSVGPAAVSASPSASRSSLRTVVPALLRHLVAPYGTRSSPPPRPAASSPPSPAPRTST